MSSKGDNDQLIERVRRSNTVSLTTTTTAAPTALTNKPAQQSIISAVGDRNIEVSQSQSKLVNERRKNIPPYTNFNTTGSTVKSNKPNIKNTVVETSMTSTACMKPGLTIPSESNVLSNSSSVSLRLISSNKTEKTNQPQKNSGEKTFSSFQSSNDDHNSSSLDFQDQMKQIPPSFEKNIQNKALTVTHVQKPSLLTSSTPKETRTLNLFSSPASSGKISANAEIFKAMGNAVTMRPSIENKKSPSPSPRILCASGVQGSSKANSTLMNAELTKNIPSKSSVADVSTTAPPKKLSTGILPFSDPARSSAETSPNTPVKPIVTSSRIFKSIAANNTSISVAQAFSSEIGSTTLRGNSISSILSSLSQKGPALKEVLDMINAGDDVTFTPSVTISKPTMSTLSSASILKGKAGATTDVTQKTNASNSPSASGNSRKHDNVTEVSSGVPSPETDTSREANVSTSSTDVGKYDSSSFIISSDETETKEEINSSKINLQEEPECLTISSDEETEENEQFIGLSDKHEISFSVSNKEPPLVEKNEKLSVTADGNLCEPDEESALDNTSGDGYVSLNCRTVRIGSLKLSPPVPVVLSKFGLRIVIPSSEDVVLKIPFREITRVLIHFGKSVPVIFYYVTENMGVRVRNILKMDNPQDAYFDPNGLSESQRRITLLPEHITDTNRVQICEIFQDTNIMRDLSHEEANQILVRSAPKEVQRVVKQVPDPVQTIMVFPPPPAKGGISINTEDYSCLARDVFLNDVIIDFYLKYLYLNHLSEEDREKTHIFSSFFYKRLTDKATPMPRHLKSGESHITPAEIRHSRVKNWTKNIDIFSKDYIVIPLNENQHWFLAIICFPGLRGPVKFSDDSPIEVESKKKVPSNDEDTSITTDSEKPSSSIGSVTITPIKSESKEKARVFLDDDDVEDRDEAEATDEDVNISEEDTDEEYLRCGTEDLPKPKTKSEREPIKQPCILIFDSLASASRARIIATLRDYLRVEYKTKHGEDRDFTKNVVKGSVPSVPQQDNFTDCGLFVLQYVESFFDNKITDYHIPIRTLKNWFQPENVSYKRYDIQQLLHKLMKVQDIDVENLKLPNLHLSASDDEDGYYDSEEYDPDDYSDYDVIELPLNGIHSRYGFHEEDELFDDEDDEEGLIHGSRYDVFDESDEDETHEDMDSDDDNSDEVYKDLDDVEAMKAKQYRRVPHRMETSVRYVPEEGEEDDELEEEEVEASNEEEEEEQQLSSDIEEKINNSNLNRETVSIKLTSVNNRSYSPASSSSGSQTAIVTSTTPNTKSKHIDLAKLKPGRPWKTTDQSNDDCSSVKKFKPN